MPELMWFGNEKKFQWVPMPRTGMGAANMGYTDEIEIHTGRKIVYRTNQFHKEFALSFPVQDASGASGLDVFNRYASGLYGDTNLYPLFFSDKMHWDQNLFPAGWAAPGLYERGWANIASDTVTEFRNYATNPSVEVNSTGYTHNSGTGGAGTGARTGSSAVSGTYGYRLTWSTANTVIGGGVWYEGTQVAANTTYEFSAYATTSIAQRVALSVIFRSAGGAQVGSTITSVHEVMPVQAARQLSVVTTTPSTAVYADIRIEAIAGTSAVLWATGNWLQMDAVLIAPTSAHPGNYFDGSFPNAKWDGTAHASTSTMSIDRSTPTITTTAANAYGLPEVQATFPVVCPVDAYPTMTNKYGEIPYALIPIPPGYTLWMGATGSRTGSAVLRVDAFNTPADPAAPATSVDLTLLSSTGSTRLNASFSGSLYQFAKVYITRTSTSTSTITLSSMMAQLWPTGTTPTLTGQWIAGQGHRGLKFGDNAVVEEYIMTNRHLKGLSTTLIESQERG
jgi:hypothetical protein